MNFTKEQKKDHNGQIFELNNYFNSNGYCQVNNIFHPQLIEYFKVGSSMLEIEATEEINSKAVQTNLQHSISKYSPTMGENLLIYLTPIYSQISGKNLIPTYSFYRKYYKTNILKPHLDRPSCQYSATIQLDRSKNKSWPIWVKNKLDEDRKLLANIGDVIFYKGQEVLHWRKKLKYEYSSHIFLHWVDGDDPAYKEFWWDGRERLGSHK